ncbi:MAG: hypothetical protein NZM26_04705 [Patescibacteria group bacterium]|nr:hypothetical protein [Patescibacteria group bacterium]
MKIEIRKIIIGTSKIVFWNMNFFWTIIFVIHIDTSKAVDRYKKTVLLNSKISEVLGKNINGVKAMVNKNIFWAIFSIIDIIITLANLIHNQKLAGAGIE